MKKQVKGRSIFLICVRISYTLRTQLQFTHLKANMTDHPAFDFQFPLFQFSFFISDVTTEKKQKTKKKMKTKEDWTKVGNGIGLSKKDAVKRHSGILYLLFFFSSLQLQHCLILLANFLFHRKERKERAQSNLFVFCPPFKRVAISIQIPDHLSYRLRYSFTLSVTPNSLLI